jgi:hypothetical protein
MQDNSLKITNIMIYDNYSINRLDYRKSALYYLFKNFSSESIDILAFKEKFKIGIMKVAKNELYFLIKHNKITIDKSKIIFNFKNKEEIIKYQYLLSKSI